MTIIVRFFTGDNRHYPFQKENVYRFVYQGKELQIMVISSSSAKEESIILKGNS